MISKQYDACGRYFNAPISVWITELTGDDLIVGKWHYIHLVVADENMLLHRWCCSLFPVGEVFWIRELKALTIQRKSLRGVFVNLMYHLHRIFKRLENRKRIVVSLQKADPIVYLLGFQLMLAVIFAHCSLGAEESFRADLGRTYL